MQTLDAIKTRRTIRKFTEDPVSHEVIEKIVEASAYAPSWKNTQTARYIIIEETALKDRIAKEAVMGFEWNTGIILGAPVLVVLASVPGKSGYEKDGAYSTSKKDKWEMFDAGIAAQTFQLAAHDSGVRLDFPICRIGSVVMGIFDEVKVKELLGLDDTLNVSALIAIGHPAIQPTAPARKPVQELIQYR